MIFDESIRVPPLWLTEDTLHLLNQNREEIKNKKTTNKPKNRSKSYPVFKKINIEVDEDYGFCHQCKQRKSKIILAKCSYNSSAMGHAIPSYITVKGIKAYNVEVYNTQAINYVLKTQVGDSRKKKESETCQNSDYEYYECNRMYCSFCLKFHYDQALADCKKGWLCPFCQGICHCTRCSRQDQLVKMRALLYAEGGNLDHLFDSNNKINQIIGENWVRAEKVMIKVPLPNNRFEDIEELISTSKERK